MRNAKSGTKTGNPSESSVEASKVSTVRIFIVSNVQLKNITLKKTTTYY